MKPHTDNFVDTTILKEEERTQEINIAKDPFGDIKTDIEGPKYYRLNEKVFAQPLDSICVQEMPLAESGQELPELTFVGNIGVQKRPGKKNKKYFIDVEDVASLTCPQQNCHRKFTSTKLMKAHIRKVHCADRNRYICDRCGAGFPAKYLLERHSYVHEQRKVECVECGRGLSARTKLSEEWLVNMFYRMYEERLRLLYAAEVAVKQ